MVCHHAGVNAGCWRTSGIIGCGTMNSSCVTVLFGCVKIGRSSGASASCSSLPPRSASSSTSAASSPSRSSVRPSTSVEVPGDRVPADARTLVVAADRSLVPLLVLERGLHRLDAQVADHPERRVAVQLGRVVAGSRTTGCRTRPRTSHPALQVVGHVDDVEVAADGEHLGAVCSPARRRAPLPTYARLVRQVRVIAGVLASLGFALGLFALAVARR